MLYKQRATESIAWPRTASQPKNLKMSRQLWIFFRIPKFIYCNKKKKWHLQSESV